MDKLLTVADLCEYLQVSRSTVNRLVGSGELAAFKIGGQLRFSEADVNAHVKAARVRQAKRPAPPAPPRKTVRVGGKTAAVEPFRYVPGMKVV